MIQLFKKCRSLRGLKDDEGSVMLEFVIAFPLVLFMMMACFQFAHIWIANQVVHYAAFAAARSALVSVTDPSPDSEDPNNESWPTKGKLTHIGLQAPFTRGNSIGSGKNGLAESEAEWMANKTASRVCAWISLGVSDDGLFPEVEIPEWGAINGSTAVERKTRATLTTQDMNVIATVEHDFPLITPIVGQIMAAFVQTPSSDHEGLHDIYNPNADYPEDVTRDAHRIFDVVKYPHLRLTQRVVMPKPYRTVIAARDWN